MRLDIEPGAEFPDYELPDHENNNSSFRRLADAAAGTTGTLGTRAARGEGKKQSDAASDTKLVPA